MICTLDLELYGMLHDVAHNVHTAVGEGWRLPTLDAVERAFPRPRHSVVLVRADVSFVSF